MEVLKQIRVRLRKGYYKSIIQKCGKNLIVDDDVKITWPSKLEIGNNVTINQRVFLQCSPYSSIHVGDGVVFSYESMILTAGHPPILMPKEHLYKDVTIEENVKVLAKALIVSGVTIGRGAIIGAGAVVRNNIPPYAIVAGNPAKIIGFVGTPDEIIEHEDKKYPPEKRLQAETLERNYQKYFLKRLNEIKEYTKL